MSSVSGADLLGNLASRSQKNVLIANRENGTFQNLNKSLPSYERTLATVLHLAQSVATAHFTCKRVSTRSYALPVGDARQHGIRLCFSLQIPKMTTHAMHQNLLNRLSFLESRLGEAQRRKLNAMEDEIKWKDAIKRIRIELDRNFLQEAQ